MSLAGCAALVLAGGRSSRMGLAHKALATLAGQPMLGHVLARLRPQVDRVVLSLGDDQHGFAGFGLPCVHDCRPSHRGPLSGLHAGLQWARGQTGLKHLLLCPCDAPFLPLDLAGRLAGAGDGTNLQLAVARYAGHLQPTFSLWPVGLAAEVAHALQDGQGGLMRLLRQLPCVPVDWPQAQPDPFFNVNAPADLDQARAWLDPDRGQA